ILAVEEPCVDRGERELHDLTRAVDDGHQRIDLAVFRRQGHEVDPAHAAGVDHGEGKGEPVPIHCSSPTTCRTTARNCFSAQLAVAMISARTTGSRASGKHMSVTTDKPRFRKPAWTPTITSGTVDIPTTSAPICRRKRYSARVSRFGPGTATNTP